MSVIFMYFTVGYSWMTGLVAFIFVLDFFVLEIVFVFLPEIVFVLVGFTFVFFA